MTLYIPPLTVVLLTYNRLHYLKESLGAILNQSYRDFELLVLDNHSTDGTGEYILGLQDPRIRYVRNSENFSTVQFNCLSAYHIALGRRVIVTHDDDVMESDMLERQMQFMDANPQVHLVWTRVSDIDQDGRPIPAASPVGADRVFAPGEYISSFLRERLWPMPSGVMIERTKVPKQLALATLFNATATPMEAAGIDDVLLPARVNRYSAIGYIDRPLLRRRVHTNQFTHSASLSRPGVYLYRRLRSIASETPALRAKALHFEAYVARFDMQEAITTNESAIIKKNILTRVCNIAKKLTSNIETCPEASLAGLPILLLSELATSESWLDKLIGLEAEGYDTATLHYLAWAQRIRRKPRESILEPLVGRRIFVFGSAFVAALLVLDAQKQNNPIVACIDSNVNRQGRQLLGVPIQSLVWMRDNVASDDIIIISSERDHESYIESIIRNNVGSLVEIVSWKELVK